MPFIHRQNQSRSAKVSPSSLQQASSGNTARSFSYIAKVSGNLAVISNHNYRNSVKKKIIRRVSYRQIQASVKTKDTSGCFGCSRVVFPKHDLISSAPYKYQAEKQKIKTYILECLLRSQSNNECITGTHTSHQTTFLCILSSLIPSESNCSTETYLTLPNQSAVQSRADFQYPHKQPCPNNTKGDASLPIFAEVWLKTKS